MMKWQESTEIIQTFPNQYAAKAALKMVRMLRQWECERKQGNATEAAIYQARYYIMPDRIHTVGWHLAGIGISKDETRVLREFLAAPKEHQEEHEAD